MSGILSAIYAIDSDTSSDEDTSDKLSRRYSIILLIAFCAVVSTKEYVGDPINCWLPDSFSPWMRDYANDMCWVKDTHHTILEDGSIKTSINYYQWVPIVLVVQASLFYLPHMAWKGLNHLTGWDLASIVKILNDTTFINQDVRIKAISFVGQHVGKFLCAREKERSSSPSYIFRGLNGSYMMTVYFMVKLLYLINRSYCMRESALCNRCQHQKLKLYLLCS